MAAGPTGPSRSASDFPGLNEKTFNNWTDNQGQYAEGFMSSQEKANDLAKSKEEADKLMNGSR